MNTDQSARDFLIRQERLGEERGTAYLIMQHLEGETLTNRLLRSPDPALAPSNLSRHGRSAQTPCASVVADLLKHGGTVTLAKSDRSKSPPRDSHTNR
jgi:hypothetical protein